MTLRVLPPPSDSSFPASDEITDVQPRTTDAGNARAFVALMGQDFRYVVQWERWLHWTGTHWAREGADLALFAAVVACMQVEYSIQSGVVATARKEHLEAAKAQGIGSPAEVQAKESLGFALALLKFLHASQNSSKVRACIDQLRGPLVIHLKELDANPWLLPCANGTVDLRTADILPHAREHYLTQCLPIPFSLDAKCPTWLRFLQQCMGDRTKLVLYLQRLVGYTLSASTQEHLLVFCYGGGSNGKSTFLRVLHELLGPYGASCPRTMLFAQKSGEVHPTELATLYGMRLGVCSEIGEDSKIDEAKLKDLTGGDPISCRRMQENFWTFTPTHKLWIAGNHKPGITGTDDGIWRRQRVIPWEVHFGEGLQDKELVGKLLAELPGILAWAVHGCLDWLAQGLMAPEEVMQATNDYRTQSDAFGAFVRTHLVVTPEGKMSCKALRRIYEEWCEELGHLPLGAQKIGKRLRTLGVKDSTMRNAEGKVVDAWVGVRQRADYELTPP